jgi:NAD(P) transhydrogenase subunit beta
MFSSIGSLSYILAGVLFVLSLRGLSTQESARRGNFLGALGMILAMVLSTLRGRRRRWQSSFCLPLWPSEQPSAKGWPGVSR